jgi:hypothetical protein
VTPNKGPVPHIRRPITPPDGRELRILLDAGQHIANMPEAEQDAPEWRTAIAVLMLVVERGGDPLLPRIAIIRALATVRRSP